ncbi:LptE family protein [Sphingobacteriaceae bacterium WQ 2009]|uniref:LptE family protein n=1 Tax=Rhinopithecimicrobium faecis TaxID=2820698 RepID=A0A8T4H9E5_9SPHI|nr:LptE family protein [Sphingobacteriaceae bacterium WQ 2009]
MHRLKNVTLKSLLYCSILTLMVSCGVSYSFTGGSIPEGMKTVDIQYFENISALVNPTLSQNFTEGLKERIRNQSRLSQVSAGGDGIFEGFITDYTITPAAVEAGTDRAALNRITITIKVKYTNSVKTDDSFEETFSRFKDFSTQNTPLESQEEQLTKDIILMLTEDVYNRAFANW